MTVPPAADPPAPIARPRRARSRSVHDAILRAFREELIDVGFDRLRLERVAARAGASKATIYRRWRSKEDLAQELLRELVTPRLEVGDMGDTRLEMASVALDMIRRLTDPDLGPVIRRLLCAIASDPVMGRWFRANAIEARRAEVRAVVKRGVARGDLRSSLDPQLVAEMLAGPIYHRLLFGGPLDDQLAEEIVATLLDQRAAEARRT